MVKFPSLRRPAFFVNCPKTIRRIMVDRLDNYPKSPLMVDTLDALLGDSIFTVSGPVWKRQHRVINEVFRKLRLADVFLVMRQPLDDFLARLEARVGREIDIDVEMAHVTADVIFRAMFSRPISDSEAQLIFSEFTRYQDNLPHTTGWSIFLGKAGKSAKMPKAGQDAARNIREVIARLLAERRSGAVRRDDICQIIAECRDPETDVAFTESASH